MVYARGAVVHDADSHVLESPDWLLTHVDPPFREQLGHLWMRGLGQFAQRVIDETKAAGSHPDGWAEMVSGLLTRKNWWALGATRPADRSLALDLLGFASQLVFSTHSSRTLLCPIQNAVDPRQPGPPPAPDDLDLVYAGVTAHNRAMVAFCANDLRLLPVGWVRLDDPARAVAACREALELGCMAIEIPSHPAGPRSLTHISLDALYAELENASRPLLFHLGSGGTIPDPAFGNNGLPRAEDATGNSDPLRPLRTIGLSAPVETAVAALIFDGVLDRHPGLMVGVIEQGATWVPGFLRRVDLAVRLDHVMRGREHAPGDLPLSPSEYVLRQVRFTPFPGEPLGWIIDQSDPSLFMFSTDYPHAEGGDDPIGAFTAELAGQPPATVDRFFRRNFEDLLGSSPAPG